MTLAAKKVSAPLVPKQFAHRHRTVSPRLQPFEDQRECVALDLAGGVHDVHHHDRSGLDTGQRGVGEGAGACIVIDAIGEPDEAGIALGTVAEGRLQRGESPLAIRRLGPRLECSQRRSRFARRVDGT